MKTSCYSILHNPQFASITNCNMQWGCVKTLNYKKQASLYVNIKPYSEALFFIQK